MYTETLAECHEGAVQANGDGHGVCESGGVGGVEDWGGTGVVKSARRPGDGGMLPSEPCIR